MNSPPREIWPRLRAVMAVGATGLLLALGATRFPAFDAEAVPTVAGLLLLLGVCSIVRPEDPGIARRIRRLAVLAFMVHLAIGMVINRSRTLVGYLGGDAITYDQGARVIVARWQGAMIPFPHLGPGKEGFYYALAGLYWAFGVFPVAGLALNAFFAAALVPLFYDLTRRLFGPEAGWYAALIVILQPGFLVWTSQLLREAGILFFLTVALACAIRLADRASPGPVFFLAADLALALTFRADVALVAAAGLTAGLILGRRQDFGSIISAAAVAGMVIVLVGAIGLGHSGYKASSSITLKQVSLARTDLAGSAKSGFDQTADVSTTSRAITYLPKGLPSFLFGPFPWQLRNVRQLLGGIEALTVLGLTPAVRRGWRASRSLVGRRRAIFFLPAAGMAISLALLIGNYGTVVRERLQVLVFVVPLAALGISTRRSERRAKVESSLGPIGHELTQ